MYKFSIAGTKVAVYTIDGEFRGAYTWDELFSLGFLGE